MPEGPSLFHAGEADAGREGGCGKRRELKSEMKESESGDSPKKSWGSGQLVDVCV